MTRRRLYHLAMSLLFVGVAAEEIGRAIDTESIPLRIFRWAVAATFLGYSAVRIRYYVATNNPPSLGDTFFLPTSRNLSSRCATAIARYIDDDEYVELASVAGQGRLGLRRLVALTDRRLLVAKVVPHSIVVSELVASENRAQVRVEATETSRKVRLNVNLPGGREIRLAFGGLTRPEGRRLMAAFAAK